MKKLTAILLLAILIFNWIGYRFVVDYLQHKADIQLEARLDKKQYDESQLIELKVAIHLPYQISWAEYERYDGEISLNGTLYNYVERKVSNDTLYLKCLPNTKKMHLETAKDDFFKNTNDLAQNNNSQKSGNSKTMMFKKMTGDFYQTNLLFSASLIPGPVHLFAVYVEQYLLSSTRVSPEQPPDLFVA
ncbi:MAG TPA: hypothetical protein VGP55_15810 [Chitinophagaceae bacterium]|nr:hypothetical protein [Chitinophagaceae bacterium]